MTHSKKEFFLKRQKEFYHKKAEDKSIRARSYYKLKQIDDKYHLISENINIIDLGSAPGGWLQYLDRKFTNIKVIGIDILSIKYRSEFSKNIQILEDDFHNIEEYINSEEKFNLVLSDMAPEFSGSSKTDRGKTHKLNYAVLKFCQKYLAENGDAVMKTFGGEDLKHIIKKAETIFKKVTFFKPKSSQRKSAEIFLICLNKI